MNDDSKYFLMLSLQQLLETKPSSKGEKNTQRSKAVWEKTHCYRNKYWMGI